MYEAAIVYHANCPDGAMSAAVAFRALREKFTPSKIFLHPATYGTEPPAVLNEIPEIYILDFTYKPQVIRNLLQKNLKLGRLVLLDHHESAIQDFDGEMFDEAVVELILRKEHSGAGLAWEYFYPGESVPAIVAAIEDRDLWRFALPNTKNACAAASFWTKTFDVDRWENLLDADFEELVNTGKILVEYDAQLIERYIKNTWITNVDEFPITTTVLPLHLLSEGLHRLAEETENKIAMGLQVTEKHFGFSLRSIPGAPRTSLDVAKAFGGGGHEHAAGFRIWRRQLPDLLRLRSGALRSPAPIHFLCRESLR